LVTCGSKRHLYGMSHPVSYQHLIMDASYAPGRAHLAYTASSLSGATYSPCASLNRLFFLQGEAAHARTHDHTGVRCKQVALCAAHKGRAQLAFLHTAQAQYAGKAEVQASRQRVAATRSYQWRVAAGRVQLSTPCIEQMLRALR
jgi:hypothetical protein